MINMYSLLSKRFFQMQLPVPLINYLILAPQQPIRGKELNT